MLALEASLSLPVEISGRLPLLPAFRDPCTAMAPVEAKTSAMRVRVWRFGDARGLEKCIPVLKV